MTYVEKDCTVTFEGKTFEAGGAVVTPDYIIAYVGKPVGDGMGCDKFGETSRRTLTDWHGNPLGHVALGKGWPIRSHMSSRMYQAYATVNGVTYTGRTLGEGMVFRGRRVKSKP